MGTNRSAVHWQLHLDEAGNLSEPTTTAVVAGLFMRSDLRAASVDTLRRTLAILAPEIRWPPHTAYLHRPAHLALLESTRPERPADHPQAAFRQLAQDALELLRTYEPKALDRALATMIAAESVGRRPEPHWEDLTLLDQTLRRHSRRTWVGLRSRCQQILDALRSVLQAVDSEASASEPDAIAAVIAGSESLPVATSTDPDERYDALLEVLLERVVDVLGALDRLGRHERTHHVWISVLDRRRRFSDTTIPMMPRDIGTVAQRVRTADACRVRLIPAFVLPFDAKVDARLVLADFIANRTRRAVESPTRSLRDVQGQLLANVGLPARAPVPGLSHLAAFGNPREVITAAREGTTAVEPSDGIKQWATDQMREWDRSFRGEG